MARCSWCEKAINSNELTSCKLGEVDEDEEHYLCSTCHLSGHACQSSCPSCWYNLAQLLIIKECLCSGCLNSIDCSNKLDSKGHRMCDHCHQCLLCSFRQEMKGNRFQLPYREHEPKMQRILYYMQLSVQRIEMEREPCSICMESLNARLNNPVRTLDVCQHRFHTICIEKWFKQKPCCPCCRHNYQTQDEPKLKRIRRDHHLHHFQTIESSRDIY